MIQFLGVFSFLLALVACSDGGVLEGNSESVVAPTPEPEYIESELPIDYLPAGLPTVTDPDLGEVFQVTDYARLFDKQIVRVDTSKSYRVSGDFKSIGLTQSRLYLGVSPHNENKSVIIAHHNKRVALSRALVQSYDLINSIITTAAPVSDWHQPPMLGYFRFVGFYFDGDDTHQPDYIHTGTRYLSDGTDTWRSAEPSGGGYASALGSSITLNDRLPQEVIAQITPQTVVYDHHSGGTYHYTAASNALVPTEWTNYSGVITGEQFNAGSNSFRVGTKWARIIILANYRQDENSSFLMKNLKLEEIIVPEPL